MISDLIIKEVADSIDIEFAMFKAFILVESSGRGFGKDGKLIIQFEPHLFSEYLNMQGMKHTLEKVGTKYKLILTKGSVIEVERGKWIPEVTAYKILNGVEGQIAEWHAFNIAWGITPMGAVYATSIGLPQILGKNCGMLGFDNPLEMWEFFKESERNQLIGLSRFIKSHKKLHQSLKDRNYHLIATYYNGGAYKRIAKELGVPSYDVRMKNAREQILNSL